MLVFDIVQRFLFSFRGLGVDAFGRLAEVPKTAKTLPQKPCKPAPQDPYHSKTPIGRHR